MVAIIHAHVKSVHIDAADLRPYQKFFGRYIIFFVVGQLQTLLLNIAIKINSISFFQCHDCLFESIRTSIDDTC